MNCLRKRTRETCSLECALYVIGSYSYRICVFACETQQNNLNKLLPSADMKRDGKRAKKIFPEFLDEKWCA